MANSGALVLPPEPSSSVAWVFPGQGSQEVGMGRDLWEHSAAARSIFAVADEVLGFAVSTTCFDGPEERLRDTRLAQPAIVIVSLAALAAALESGVVHERPAFLAGHSVGEYAALIVSGALTLEDGLRLLQQRARLMAAASEENPGILAAVIGLDEATVRNLCAAADADICNLNLPNQTVVGGTVDAVREVIARAKDAGAQRAIELNVSGAFHSRLMKSAEAGMAAAVAGLRVAESAVPVIANLSADTLISAAAVKDELCRQVASPVRWHESIARIAAAGVSTFIEFGSGRVLTGMIRRLQPDAKLMNISGFKDAAPAGAEV